MTRRAGAQPGDAAGPRQRHRQNIPAERREAAP
jgi:hypothetical protein